MKIPTLILACSLFVFTSCASIQVKDTREIKDRNKTTSYIETEAFSKLNLPFSQAVRHGDFLFLSGQIGADKTGKLVPGGIVPETRQAMTNIKEILEQNGASMDQIVKCTCMLADISEWAQMSDEYIKFFPNHKPARSAFAASGLGLHARVEIECMAYLK